MEGLELSGVLRSDSAACHAQLCRELGDDVADAMSSLYRRLFEDGRLSEDPILREPGVSFNPRAARVCQILMTEASETSPSILAAGMLAACPGSGDYDGWAAELRLAREVRDGLVRGERPEGEARQAVMLAVLLDDVRHLHMTSLDEEERASALARISGLSAAACSYRLEPLRTKIAAAIDRYVRSRRS